MPSDGSSQKPSRICPVAIDPSARFDIERRKIGEPAPPDNGASSRMCFEPPLVTTARGDVLDPLSRKEPSSGHCRF